MVRRLTLRTDRNSATFHRITGCGRLIRTTLVLLYWKMIFLLELFLTCAMCQVTVRDDTDDPPQRTEAPF